MKKNHRKKALQLQQRSRFFAAYRLWRKMLSPSNAKTPPENWLSFADAARLAGFFPEACRAYEKACRILWKKNPQKAFDAKVGKALALRGAGRYLEALSLLHPALRFYRKQGDREGEAFSLWAFGGCLRLAGRFTQAFRHLKTALTFFRKEGDETALGFVHCALGGIERMRGFASRSRKHYEKALAYFQKENERFGTAYAYCGLGNAARRLGQFEKGLRFFKRAERLYLRIQDRVSYAYTLWSLGTLWKMQYRLKKAEQCFHAAFRLFQETGDDRGSAYAAMGFAELAHLKGDQRIHRKWLRKAEGFAKKGPYPWEAAQAAWLKNPTQRFPAERFGSVFQPREIPVNWP